MRGPWNPGSFALFRIRAKCRVSQQNKVSISLDHLLERVMTTRSKKATKDFFLRLWTLRGAGWAEAVGSLMVSTNTCRTQLDSD